MALAAIAVTTPAAAQRTLAIAKFEAHIVVNSDGTVDVTEMITARFKGEWNGIYRTVPVDYHTPQGFNWSLRLSETSATSDDGAPLRLESSRTGHYQKFKIWVPGAKDATRTVWLHYRATNGLRFFDDHDELYWNITGDEWDVPIESATAEITLPAGAAGVRAIAFNGVYGGTARDAKVKIVGDTVLVRMPKALGFHEGITAVVGWDTGLVARPTPVQKASGFLAVNWPLLLPLPVLLGMLVLWWKRGRDPRKRPVTVQYEPPEDVTPAEAGVLLDERADVRDVIATLVDMAVRGFIRIEEREEPRLFGLWTEKEFVFHRVKPRDEWRGLDRHEQLLLEGLFDEHGDSVELSDLKNEFYRSMGPIRTAVTQRLVDSGYYRADPATVRNRWRFGAIFLGFVTFAAGGVMGARFGFTPLPFMIAGVLIALIVGILGHLMPARTVPGTRTLEQVLGFEEFLSRVEKENYARVAKTPEMFERFLPYAMAFGVERQWARAFKDIVREPPRWYTGGNVTGFDAGSFTGRMSALSSRAGSAMTSSPRSSGGSGFGGGGSSGGGSGGGGGGGF
ncbi:MAG: conserved rane protein of unknown function [Gemmatimonadetes bacterium]|nr:conserved rane protein of unknown function [Gemmatimonadota bacterium]